MTASSNRSTGKVADLAARTARFALVTQGHCLHMLGGAVAMRRCTIGYNCAKCQYDQMLEDSGMLAPSPARGAGPMALAA